MFPYVQLTTRCNMQCAHCCGDYGPVGDDMPMAVLRAALPMCEDGCCLGGGEPTVHPLFEVILFEAIAACSEDEDEGGVLVITNGKIAKRAIMLAKLAKAGIIHAELSRDEYHEEIDPKVVEAFGGNDERSLRRARLETDDNRGIRRVLSSRVVRSGRCDWGVEECVCEGPIVEPGGSVRVCACDGSPILGSVLNPEFDVWSAVDWERDPCGRGGTVAYDD